MRFSLFVHMERVSPDQDQRQLYQDFLTLAKMAEQCKRVSADLYGWSAMTWKAHWPMRLGVTLARARAALVTEGVRCRQQVAGDGQRDPEAEEKRVSMQYRA